MLLLNYSINSPQCRLLIVIQKQTILEPALHIQLDCLALAIFIAK